MFGTRFAAQLWSFFIFAIVFWVIGGVNVLLALNSGRRLSSIGIRQRLLTAPSTILAMLAVFLLGLLFGQIASGQWQTILTYLNQKPFNVQDPIWHKDVGYYVFTLPFYRFLWGWFLGVVILMTLVVAGLYASRAGLQNLVLPTRAVRHLSVLAAVFATWFAVERTLSIHTIFTTRREAFYWLAILFTFALGTAAGDLSAEKLSLGYGPSILIFGGMIAAVTLAHFAFKLNAVLAFWLAYILTRPLGASIGDWMSQHSSKYGGLGLGTTGTSYIFLGSILALVSYLTITRRDQTRPEVAPA